MPTKQLKRYAVIDWNAETVSMRKTKPSESEISPNELVAVHTYEVRVPEIDIPEVAAEFDVSQANVKKATYELLDLRDEQPEWVATAEEELERIPTDHPDHTTLVTVLGETMFEHQYADPEEVEAYIRDRLEYHKQRGERREA